MNDPGVVYIVHHVDTEGPLWEQIEETFVRLKAIFGLDLSPTYDNLERLQKGDFDLPLTQKNEIAAVVDPHTIGFKRNWAMVEEMLFRVMHSSFRNQLKDSFGGGWVYNWHVMDHVGFGPENPRHRDMGHHNIFDFYRWIIRQTQSFEDAMHWHFHPIPFYKQANVMATSYDNSMAVLHQIICKRLLDRNSFPVVNRAGFHAERIDSNLFLEQWIPFDPSNIAVENTFQPKYQKDQINGRFADWNGAPDDWSIYHPDFSDWRLPGNLKRYVARILNLKARHRNITVDEIEKAFRKAAAGENVYLGLANHDWREMSVEIEEFRDMLRLVIQKYPRVPFKFSEAVYAFQRVIGYKTEEINQNALELQVALKDGALTVKVNKGETFGPQPYLAFKTKNGEYFHDNFDFLTPRKTYSYVFDEYTVPLANIEQIAVASNDKYGNTCIKKISSEELKGNEVIYSFSRESAQV